MEIFDTELKKALEIAYNKKWDAYEAENASCEEYVFPEGYNEKVLNQCFKVLNTGIVMGAGGVSVMEFSGKPHFRKVLLVAALVAVILIGTAAAYAVAHPEIVYNIKKSIIEWTFHFQQTDPVTVADEFTPLKPEIPVGFDISDETITEHSYTAIYEDGNGHIVYYDQNEADGLGLNIDAETDITEIEINGNKGVSYKKYDDWIIVWDNGYYVLELTGNVEYDVLIRMVNSITESRRNEYNASIPYKISYYDGPLSVTSVCEDDSDSQKAFKHVIPEEPEGYEIVHKDLEQLETFLVYENDLDENIVYSQLFCKDGYFEIKLPEGGTINVIKEIINGRNAIILDNDDEYYVIIEDGSSVFEIRGTADSKIIRDMATDVVETN